MATDINALENTIQTLIATAAGLAGNLVVWENQDNPRLTAPYLSLRSEDLPRLGSVENSVRDNPSPSAGQEILLKSKSEAEFEIYVSAFSLHSVSSASLPSATAMLHALRQTIEGETLGSAMEAAGLTLVSLGAIRNLPRVLETQYQGRATLVLKFRISDELEEAITYIQTAESFGTFS